jgi:hypothetical protein
MSRLWEKTQELLRTTEKSMPQICIDTGLSYGWLMSAKYGKGKRGPVIPSVEKAEKLYEYLSGKQLEV